MMKGTIERLRRASSWILNPTCLIDRLLDRIEKLSVVLALPPQRAGLSCIEARVDRPIGA